MKHEMENEEPGWYEIHFDSPSDMLTTKPSSAMNIVTSEKTRRTGGESWTKCDNYDAFRSMIRGGALAFTESVMKKVDMLTVAKPLVKSLIQVNKRRQCVADEGDELDFDRWQRGDDKCYRSTRKVQIEEQRHRAACLFVNLMATGGTHADSCEWRSAAIIKIAKLLTASGWTVEIVVGWTVSNWGQNAPYKLGITFDAKPSTMPLSVERLALQTSAAWMRYCIFEAYTANEKGYYVDSTYGYCDAHRLPPRIMRKYNRGYKLVQIPGSCFSQAHAQMAINNAIREVQGG